MVAKSEIMDFGGLDFKVRSLLVDTGEPGDAGTSFFNGVTNTLTVPGPLVLTSDTFTGAGAIPITTALTILVTTGANALTLANGVLGQVKMIVMLTDGGAGTLTPANLAGGTTLTFDDVGDAATLVFNGVDWCLVGTSTATLA